MSSRKSGAGRRIGVWAADPITAAGIMALLPLAGFEPVAGADLQAIDALLIATDSAQDTEPQLLTAAADVEGIPVVWMHRRHDLPLPGEVPLAGVTVVRADLVPVEEVGQALLAALLSRLEPERGVEVVAPVDPLGDRLEPDALLPMEREVLRLLAEGSDTAEIAGVLFYSERTVKNAISRAVRNLGAANRSQAVATAIRSGIL